MIARMLHRYRWLLVALVVLVAAPVVGTFVYLNVLRDDPPARLSLADVTTTTGGIEATGSTEGTVDIAGAWSVGGPEEVRAVVLGEPGDELPGDDALGSEHGLAVTVGLRGAVSVGDGLESP